MKINYLRADPAILKLHADVQDYASSVNSAIALAHGGVSRRPLCGAALYALTADLFGMHRAVLSVCKGGWAFTAVVLLRTMLDLILSELVITETETEAEYRGFKYTHFFLKAQLNAPHLKGKLRKAVRAQIEEGIIRLPAAYQQRARDFMFRDRLRAYWYCPEYQRPKDVLDRLVRSDINRIYDVYSGGSHGGFIGLRILKDEPDRVHPNPRPDPRSQNLALAASSRILLEAMNVRDSFENAGANRSTYDQLLDRLASLQAAQ